MEEFFHAWCCTHVVIYLYRGRIRPSFMALSLKCSSTHSCRLPVQCPGRRSCVAVAIACSYRRLNGDRQTFEQKQRSSSESTATHKRPHYSSFLCSCSTITLYSVCLRSSVPRPRCEIEGSNRAAELRHGPLGARIRPPPHMHGIIP